MRISVITIAYNSEATIRDTLKSIIQQDYNDFEYIVIDGASTDNTLSIINEYKDKIDKIISEPDKGVSDAFNKGIAHATGDLIVIINSDDYMLPHALSDIAKEYRNNDEILATNLYLLDEKHNHQYLLKPSTTFPTVPLFRKPAHQGMYIPKKVYERIGGYDIKLRCPMDLDFLMRAYKAGIPIRHIDITTAVFRFGGLTSQSMVGKRKDYIRLIRSNGGNVFQAYFFWIFIVICEYIKRFLDFFSQNLFYNLRFKEEREQSFSA